MHGTTLPLCARMAYILMSAWIALCLCLCLGSTTEGKVVEREDLPTADPLEGMSALAMEGHLGGVLGPGTVDLLTGMAIQDIRIVMTGGTAIMMVDSPRRMVAEGVGVEMAGKTGPARGMTGVWGHDFEEVQELVGSVM